MAAPLSSLIGPGLLVAYLEDAGLTHEQALQAAQAWAERMSRDADTDEDE